MIDNLIRLGKWLLAVIILPTSGITYAQSNIDSLLQVRASASHDTLKVQTDLEIANALYREEIDSARFYFDRAFDLAQSISAEFPAWMPKVLMSKGNALTQSNLDEEAIATFQKAVAISKERDLKKEQSYAQFDLGYTYQGISDFKTAVLHYDSIIARNLKDQTVYDLAKAYNFSGLCSYYLRKLEPATQRIVEGIRYSKESGDTVDIHRLYMVYGIILKEQKEYEEAKSYISRSGEIAKLSNLNRRVQLAYTNIGQVLMLQDSIDEAITSFEKAWEYQQKLGWTPVGYYNSMAWAEEERGDYRKSHEYMIEAVKTIPPTYASKSKADVLIGLVNAKMFLADSVYTDFFSERKKLLNEAIPHLEGAWDIINPINARNVKLEVAETAAKLYAKLGRFELAFEYSQIAKAISEEINDKARTEAIAKMTTEFETELVEAQNESLRESQKAQTARIKQQNAIISGVVLVLILILIIAFITYRGRLRLQQANQTIEKSLSEKELLLKEIHHRVKNNLQVVSSLLDLQSRGIEDKEALATFMEGQNRVKAMALIHQKLYQNENLATIDFEEYAGLLMAELGTIYKKDSKVKTFVRAGGQKEFDIDIAVPLGLILNELISNAYKHAFSSNGEGILSVSIETVGENRHKLIVADNGKGLPIDLDLSKAKSLGLRLVRRLAKQLYGTVTYTGDKGAKFVVIFTNTIERKTA